MESTGLYQVNKHRFPGIHILAKGDLCKAVVSLPDDIGLIDAGSEDWERCVFFEASDVSKAGTELAALLAQAWQVDTRTWLDRGLIYNIKLVREALVHEGESELDMLSCGSGGVGGIGPDGKHYWSPSSVDMFVGPRVAERLRSLFSEVEAMHGKDI